MGGSSSAVVLVRVKTVLKMVFVTLFSASGGVVTTTEGR